MVNKYRCPYVYEKGSKVGEVCGKESKYEFCYRHSKNKKAIKSKENDDENTIISSVETEEIQKRIKEVSDKQLFQNENLSDDNVDNNNDEILLTKYFVYDCIRDFFREHKEIEDIINTKKNSSGGMNMTTIMGIAGMSLLPLLLKNLSLNNIDNALYNKEVVTGLCNSEGVQPTNQPPQGTYTTIERETKGEIIQNTKHEDRTNITPTPSYLESIKGPRI